MKNLYSLVVLLISFYGISTSQTVTIGSQVWMIKNLDVSTFRNGDMIFHARTDEEWKRASDNKQPAWCFYDNNSVNGIKYGKLYNWYAVNDPRGLAPEGWRIPTDLDWLYLADYLGEGDGYKMKSNSGWPDEDDGNNESGFTGLPGGRRSNLILGISFPQFNYIGNFGFWWSSTEYDGYESWYYILENNFDVIKRQEVKKGYGFSVRCIKN